MDQQRQTKIMRSAIFKWGVTAQSFKAVEEISELITEISRKQNGEKNRHKIIEEMADVEIMMEQTKLMDMYVKNYFPYQEVQTVKHFLEFYPFIEIISESIIALNKLASTILNITTAKETQLNQEFEIVKLYLEKLKTHYQISKKELDEQRFFKLERLKKRISGLDG